MEGTPRSLHPILRDEVYRIAQKWTASLDTGCSESLHYFREVARAVLANWTLASGNCLMEKLFFGSKACRKYPSAISVVSLKCLPRIKKCAAEFRDCSRHGKRRIAVTHVAGSMDRNDPYIRAWSRQKLRDLGFDLLPVAFHVWGSRWSLARSALVREYSLTTLNTSVLMAVSFKLFTPLNYRHLLFGTEVALAKCQTPGLAWKVRCFCACNEADPFSLRLFYLTIP